jgi:hypothetical protein
MDQIIWLQELEKRPRTMNDHYFSDYKDKFLTLYRASHQSVNHFSKVTTLTKYAQRPSAVQRSSPEFAENAVRALSALSGLGFDVKAPELLKLLPPDPLEPALHIMATVRAYFQG